MNKQDLKEFLEEKTLRYNTRGFINEDPIAVPHLFSKKQDIEIAGFLAATIAWGQRKTIVKNAHKLVQMMDFTPYEFITNSTPTDWEVFNDFKHRTLNGEDCIYFVKSLQHIYKNHESMEDLFAQNNELTGVKQLIINFRSYFFNLTHLTRTEKHVSNPGKGSAAKRLNMFLRWMVRKDNKGVDFGIWNKINPAQLIIPLDVHTGNVGRKLGLLKRKQNDWESANELTQALLKFDSKDPIKYDFALFGLGIFEKF